jgi:hypothetical protein
LLIVNHPAAAEMGRGSEGGLLIDMLEGWLDAADGKGST